MSRHGQRQARIDAIFIGCLNDHPGIVRVAIDDVLRAAVFRQAEAARAEIGELRLLAEIA